MNRRPCFIHVGTHKSGTTSIQAFLRDNEDRLAQLGVCIPWAGRGNDAAGHHNLTQELLGGPKLDTRRGGLNELHAELRRSDKPRACISSEDFSLVSRSPEALRSLRDAITDAGFTPTIVIYLRPQVAYSVSMYAEIVKNGNLKPFQTFIDELREHGSFLWNGSLGPLCRYDVLLERFAAVFGADAIIVKRYRGSAPPNAILRSFAALIAQTPIDTSEFLFPREKFNPSLSFAHVLERLGAPHDVMDMRFAPFSPVEMLTFAAPFYRVNLRIAWRYGVWIPPFELRDFLLALPLRKTFARTRSLAFARRALRFGAAVRIAVGAQREAQR